MIRLLIITPVYNDWEAFLHLLDDIDDVAADLAATVSVIGVNDGSSEPLPQVSGRLAPKYLKSVEILDLASNMGHQRAIALGIAEAARRDDSDAVLIMDADGEDRPCDIALLLRNHIDHPHHIIVAKRAKRTERPTFRAFYLLYRLAFRLLTGKEISFGNFSLVPISQIHRLAHMSDTWNNLPAAYLRSQMPLCAVPTTRGSRYAGDSKMNLTTLIIHGMSGMAVFADVLFIRLLVASALLATLAAIGIVTVITMRILTDLALPGWATSAAGLLSVLFTQAVILVFLAAFILLNNRSNVSMTPTTHLDEMIRRRFRVFED